MARYDYHGISQQRKAAFKRLRDAQALLGEETSPKWRRLRAQHARGAMYIAGYAIECRLKAIAMEVYRCQTLAQLAAKWDVDERLIYSHGLQELARRLPLWSRLRRSDVWSDFAKVTDWRPSWRYDPEDWPNGVAANFLFAVRRVYDYLDSNQ